MVVTSRYREAFYSNIVWTVLWECCFDGWPAFPLRTWSRSSVPSSPRRIAGPWPSRLPRGSGSISIRTNFRSYVIQRFGKWLVPAIQGINLCRFSRFRPLFLFLLILFVKPAIDHVSSWGGQYYHIDALTNPTTCLGRIFSQLSDQDRIAVVSLYA